MTNGPADAGAVADHRRAPDTGVAWHLILVGVALIAFAASPLFVLARVYAHNPNYSHGLLVPVVAAAMLWRFRFRFLCAGNSSAWPAGFLLALGCGCVAFGHWYEVALRPGFLGHVFLQGAGLLIACGALVWMLAGWRRALTLIPVLGFLIFAVPLPESFLLPLTTALQRGVSIGSATLLRALGLEVFREGDLLHMPAAVLGVAEACSGVRSLMTFFATAAACIAFLGFGLFRACLLLALAPVAAVALNVVRVTTVGYLVSSGYPAAASGPVHEALGLGAVVLGGGLLFAGALVLDRWAVPAGSVTECDRSSDGVREAREWMWSGVSRVQCLIAAVLLLCSMFAMRGIEMHYAHKNAAIQVQRLPLSNFPRELGPYLCTRDGRLSAGEFEILQPMDHFVRSYEDPDGRPIEFTVLYWPPQRYYPAAPAVPRQPHRPSGCMAVLGWGHVSGYDAVDYAWQPEAVLYSWLFKKDGQTRFVLYWERADKNDQKPLARKSLSERFRLLKDSWNAPPAKILPGTYGVTLALEAGDNPAHARQVALDFARKAADVLPLYGVGSNAVESRQPEFDDPAPGL